MAGIGKDYEKKPKGERGDHDKTLVRRMQVN